MGFFSSKSKRHHVAIDVGSHSIQTVIFESPKSDSLPVITQRIATKLSPADKGLRTVKALHEVLFSLLKEKQQVPEKIVIGIGMGVVDVSLQEWVINDVRSRESLTPAHIQHYFQKLFDEHRDENHAFLGYPVVLEANGYPVDIHALSKWDPSLIKELTLRTILLRFPDEIGSAFGELKKMFGGITIELVPKQGVYAESLTAALNIKNAMLIDVGGSLTTLMSIHDGLLNHIASFPIGAERFSHRIMKTRTGKFVEAQDITRQYTQGIMSKDEQSQLSHVMSEEVEVWKRSLISALEEFYPLMPLPENFYLFGGGSYIPEVRSALWSHDLIKDFSSFQSLRVHIVQGNSIFNGDSLHGSLKGPEDAGIASLVYYSLYHKPMF